MYNLTEWQPISVAAPPDRLAVAFDTVIKNHPDWAPDYVFDVPRLNDLLTWTSYVESWPLRAFAYRHGIGNGKAAKPHSLRETAERFDRSPGTVANGLNPNGVRMYLVRAYNILKHAPPEMQGPNQFRGIGLPVTAWFPLAVYGEVYTVDQLCGLNPESVGEIHNIGPKKRDEIIAIMFQRGLWQ